MPLQGGVGSAVGGPAAFEATQPKPESFSVSGRVGVRGAVERQMHLSLAHTVFEVGPGWVLCNHPQLTNDLPTRSGFA